MKQKMPVDKFQAIAYFKDGSTKKSEWFYSDVYCKQWVEQFKDDENFESYKIESRSFMEEVDLSDYSFPPHPVHG